MTSPVNPARSDRWLRAIGYGLLAEISTIVTIILVTVLYKYVFARGLPDATVEGTRAFNWSNPTKPGASAANKTSVFEFPIDKDTGKTGIGGGKGAGDLDESTIHM